MLQLLNRATTKASKNKVLVFIIEQRNEGLSLSQRHFPYF